MKFTLFNLLMMLTAVAAVVGLYSSRQASIRAAHGYESVISDLKSEQELLAEENKSLKQELGFLTIVEPEKIHAVKLRTDQPKTWSYRVYLPTGRNYFFACQVNELPLDGSPPLTSKSLGPSTIGTVAKNSTGVGRPPGEYIVTLTIHQIENEWKYRIAVREAGDAGSGSVGGKSINDADAKWPSREKAISTGGVFNQKEVSLGQAPLVLLNFRAMNGDVTNSRDSNQGAMLWVDVAE